MRRTRFSSGFIVGAAFAVAFGVAFLLTNAHSPFGPDVGVLLRVVAVAAGLVVWDLI
jgi:hypothetical protein